MSRELKFKNLEVAFTLPALLGMRNPTKSRGSADSNRNYFDGKYSIGGKDLRLGSNLIKKGEDHGKFQRGVQVAFDINMPRYIWSELDTYIVGMTPISSESTMYTLVKECASVSPNMFSESTPFEVINNFDVYVQNLVNTFGDRKRIPIDMLKAGLPEGWMQLRTRIFSYQTLTRIYNQRKDHRLPEWQFICGEIKKLPHQELLNID